jgi:HlyD family type I secretion membrane fusion protein
VVEILVQENQSVQAGEPIARIDDAQLQTRKNQLQTSIDQTQLQLQQIEAQLHTLNRRIQAEDMRTQRLINATQAELRQAHRRHYDQQVTADTEVEEIEAQLRSEHVSLEAAQLQVERYEPLTKVGAMSQEQLDEAKLAVKQQEQIIAATTARLRRAQAGLNPSDAEVAISHERIAQEHASGEATLAALGQEQAGLTQQVMAMQQQQIQDHHALKQVDQELSQTIIRAPVPGTLFQLNLRNAGQTVSAGDTIAQIAPHDTGLTIRALVSTTDIHRVGVGQTTQLRISACPYPDYGTLSGKVETISPDVVTTNSIDGMANSRNNTITANQARQTEYFEIGIQPAATTFGQGSHQCTLRSGMMAAAEIIAHEETVLTFLLRKAKLLANFN